MSDPFIERMQACALSLWELGDLLGIHPHQLHTFDRTAELLHQPVHVLIELARRLDMHPADLVTGLDSVLTNQRIPTTADPPASSTPTDGDAMAVLTALATISAPLSTDELATALGWTLDRAAAALEHAATQPHLSGPLALRRMLATTWTVTARRDVLSPEQQANLAQAGSYHHSITVEEANVLLAAHRFGNHSQYATWREDHLTAEQRVKDRGLLRCHNGPHHASPSEDVRFSIAAAPRIAEPH